MMLGAVRPPVLPITDDDAREWLSKPLRKLAGRHGPTRVGAALGVDEKTIRDARDEKRTLGVPTVFNLLGLDAHALDAFLAHYGLRPVPIGSRCDTDTDRQAESAVLRAALALSVALSDDDAITPVEVRQNEDTIIAARDALDGLLSKLTPKAVRA